MIKKIKYLFFAMMIFSSSNTFANETIFINGFEDVPQMPKLNQDENSGIAFDTEFGRIVETYLESENGITFKNVADYYNESLPELGWKEVTQTKNKLIFSREGEVLEISLMENNKPILIKVSIHD